MSFSQNPLPTDTPSIDSIPVHTMQDDIDHPLQDADEKITFTPKEKTGSSTLSVSSGPVHANISSPFAAASHANTPPLASAIPAPQTAQSQASVNPNSIPPFAHQEPSLPMSAPRSATSSAPEYIPSEPVLESPHKSHALAWTLILLILLFLTGGGYYFWTTRGINQPIDAIIDNSQNNSPATSTPAFSVDSPNYLPVSSESNTPEGMKALLRQTGKEVVDSGINKPVEFFIADQNNIKVSLIDFLIQFGITLPETLINSLSSDFSLFIFNDHGQPRIALAAISTNAESTKIALQQAENDLPRILTPLFLQDPSAPVNIPFKEANYKGLSVRFLNVIPEQGISIDYTLINNKLILATSKDTGRALIDTLLP